MGVHEAIKIIKPHPQYHLVGGVLLMGRCTENLNVVQTWDPLNYNLLFDNRTAKHSFYCRILAFNDTVQSFYLPEKLNLYEQKRHWKQENKKLAEIISLNVTESKRLQEYANIQKLLKNWNPNNLKHWSLFGQSINCYQSRQLYEQTNIKLNCPEHFENYGSIMIKIDEIFESAPEIKLNEHMGKYVDDNFIGPGEVKTHNKYKRIIWDRVTFNLNTKCDYFIVSFVQTYLQFAKDFLKLKYLSG